MPAFVKGKSLCMRKLQEFLHVISVYIKQKERKQQNQTEIRMLHTKVCAFQ